MTEPVKPTASSGTPAPTKDSTQDIKPESKIEVRSNAPEGFEEVVEEAPGVIDRFYVFNKDPNYVYRWVNTNERAMMQRRYQGWVPAPGDAEALPVQVQKQGQEIANPAGGTVQTRGDVMLMRMPREVFDRKIRKAKHEARERQSAVADAMVETANEEARTALKKWGYSEVQIRAKHVFKDTPDSKFTNS